MESGASNCTHVWTGSRENWQPQAARSWHLHISDQSWDVLAHCQKMLPTPELKALFCFPF